MGGAVNNVHECFANYLNHADESTQAGPGGSAPEGCSGTVEGMDLLFDDSALPREPRLVRPGVWHVPGWLDLEAQRWITSQFFAWGAGPVPPHHTRVAGHEMSVKSLCLGWHWSPGRYTRRAVDVNGAPVPPLPGWLARLGVRAVQQSAGGEYAPDVALVNYYDEQASMGLHQDAEERINAPVVSLSIGDSATFRLGHAEHRNGPFQDLRLASGDLLVFSGPARFAYHGVTRIHPGTAPAGGLLASGRINITLRQTGLAG